MSELRALMREDDDTASTGSEDPDAEDRATVTTVTIGDLDIVTQEATHAFGASGADQSGNVVWGAARVLAERIGGEHFAGATVVELGCGCAVPAVVAAKRGAARVVATDASQAVLRRAARTASLNDVDVETRLFDWDDLDGLRREADVVLCADCVYSEGAAPLLQKAILHIAKPGASVYVCCKSGRRGVAAFWGLMADAMDEVETKEAGDHVLKVYRSKGRGQLLDELAAKRGELADCRACMAGLKDDLRTMAVSMEADMQRLLGALSAAAAGQADARIRALEAERRVAELEAEAARLDAEAAAATGDPS